MHAPSAPAGTGELGGTAATSRNARCSRNVTVNGAARTVDAGTTVEALVSICAPSPRGIAVARNGEVVPRSTWPTTEVLDGDRVEIVTAAAGG